MIAPIEKVDAAKLYAKFDDMYTYVAETYAAHYDVEAGGCSVDGNMVTCE